MIVLGYLLVLAIIIAFIKYPRQGVYISLLTKPTLDMFWWVKAKGLVSPLYIAGVIVPILALVGLSRTKARKLLIQEDLVVMAYLSLIIILGMLKVAAMPQYTYNTFDLISRFVSTTLFYFIGKFYFQRPEDRYKLILVILASFIPPFLLTIGQQLLGINLHSFSEVYDPASGLSTGEVSAFYLEGRHGIKRISGVYEGVYELAFMGAFATLIFFALHDSRDHRFTWWQITMVPMALYMLYATYSRSAWVTTLVAVLLYSFLRRKWLTLTAIVTTVILLYLTVPVVQYRFEDELGFLLGESEFARVGYGRGNKWTWIVETFLAQDFGTQMIGRFGIGNPENQFLNALVFMGYTGLLLIVAFLIYFTLRLFYAVRTSLPYPDAVHRVGMMMAIFAFVTYWLGGLGNNFIVQISTQWILWTWTGSMIAEAYFLKTAKRRQRLLAQNGMLPRHGGA